MHLHEKHRATDHTGCASNPPALAFDTPQKVRVVWTALASLVCYGVLGCCQPNDPNCRNVSFGPSGAEVAGVAIGVGAAVAAGVAIGVHHANHTVDGCVSDGSGGMQLKTQSGAATYVLTGNTAGIRAGERVRLHGTKVKPPKRSTTARTFQVESEKKHFGPCKP